MSMICIDLKGGLGNQMFQFAAAYAKAIQEDQDLWLDTSYFSLHDKRSFLLNEFALDQRVSVFDGSVKHGLFSRFRKSSKLNTYLESTFCYDDAFASVKGPIRLDGYFQSEKYFEDCGEELRRALDLANPLSSVASETAARISDAKTSVSVHVRRGDYLDAENAKVHFSLPIQYYRKALSLLRGVLGDDLAVFYFSDDTEYVYQNFQLEPHDHVVEGDTQRPVEDLYLMAQCDHHIIANSSFSWWGAWLNRKPEKEVVAPRQWFQPDVMRRMNTCDLYPCGWITV